MGKEFFDNFVREISFEVLSPQLIKQAATVKVVTPELYDKEGYPVDGGLMDLRMGVVDPGLRCRTCGGRIKECPGHFGYMPLARPVLHVLFIPHIYSLLRSSCKECGKVLITETQTENFEENLKLSEEEAGFFGKMKAVAKLADEVKNVQKCPHCGAKKEKISLEKPYAFLEAGRRLNPVEIRARLEKISDDDLAFFGLNPKTARPEWLVLTMFPVPPVTVRPSITLESGEKSEDDLTHKISDIVRINQRLFENINAGAPEIIVEDLWDLLQYHAGTFFDNSIAQLPVARHRSGAPLKTFIDRIKTKQGRIRNNLLGKRVNFSSRTVITPDPMIDPDEVGVPFQVALKLTSPERVTEWNLEYLKDFLKRGPKEYPGANYLVRPDGKKKKVTDETKEALLEEIQPGYIVERHLIDGDIVIFNRQPSLHKMSMMAHKVRVLPGLTFRINPCVCRPYNADFDGDEMNLHVPQTEEARQEAETLMLISTQMISPRYGLSIIGAIQDAISGNYILTKFLKEVKRSEAVDLLMDADVFDIRKLPLKKAVSGKEIFSVLIPDDFDYSGKTKDRQEPELIIENGKIIKGVMDKANLGEGAGLLLRAINKQYGADFALSFMGTVVRLGIAVLMKYGFSLYISDSEVPQDARVRIDKILKDAENATFELIEKYKNNELEAFPGRTLEETLERKIMEKLNFARSEAEAVVKENINKENNPSLVLALSGARGSLLNLVQISAFVGQQALRGRRIEKGFFRRPLSSFGRDDLGPDARGFIRNGFKQGLRPHEFFYAAMTGRDSLMDTALRTPKSGYLYRRLSNSLQDIYVKSDGTVRASSGIVVQFAYGEDGIDVAKSIGGTIDVHSIVQKVLSKGD
ncbi:MAG TPA: DNA-directed RNA polymerase subunit A' [Candidatus Woesearchaeota archaeon]|nr:DNA-directed RNA polymerase subunit A' [Candidatus Woesearchaeota archaeon]